VNFLIEEGVKPTFGGHEKFVFRHGWLKKGVDAVCEDDLIFTRDEALVILGVGKNMVRSIRHWCLATDLVREKPGSRQVKPLEPSMLAHNLMLNNAWDPYLEDVGSLWLLHWQLVSNTTRALVWSIIFSAYFVTDFSKKQTIALVNRRFEQLGVRTTEGTIEREVDCLLRTYIPSGIRSGAFSEEGLDCPLAELDLIQHDPGDNLFRFNIGPKPSLPAEIFGFALFHFLSKILETRRTITIEEILYNDGSPGQAFKLDENSVVEYLEQLVQQTDGLIQLNETTGLRQLYLQEGALDTFDSIAYKLLEGYYGNV
jgi:hypothetical protein